MPDASVPEPQEVTLADLLRILWRRRVVVLAVFLLVLAGGVANAVLADPVYQADATLVAVEQRDIIQRWLESRAAAAWVGNHIGDPVLSVLFAGQWDGTGWKTGPPSDVQVGAVVSSHVSVRTSSGAESTDRTVRLVVSAGDPGVARDIANGYLDSLEAILPTLQNVTESALFVQFYDGNNAADARRQAHEVASQRQYWIIVDPAVAPGEPSSPNVPLLVAVSLVLGAVAGVVAGFVAHWVAGYRASSVPPAAPPAPEDGDRFQFRGR